MSSDGDAHAQARAASATGTAAAAQPTLHGFACDFSRGRCGHDELFHPHYTRTNLRKGDKILRCFPHCCPDHVSRSFCGASLHLDVSWSNGTPDAPDVMVFARFRVNDTRGLLAGDHVTLHEISQSLQGELNPHGEWIPAVGISSSGDNPRHWVFEINHEARWYYHWESGVAKRHRLKHHVLDVYVLSPSFSEASAASADAGDRQPLQVVASAHSPPFRLISFRRATPKAVEALSVPRESIDERPPTRKPAAARASIKKSRSPPPRSQIHSPQRPMLGARVASIHDRQWPYAGERRRPSPAEGGPSFADLTSFIDRRRAPPPPPQQPTALASMAPQLRTPMPLLTPRAPRSVSTASLAQARSAQRLGRLLGCLDRVRAIDALEHMDTFNRVYTDALSRAAGVHGAPSAWSPVDVVGQLLIDIGALPNGRLATPSVMPNELIAILSELLLWLSFDVDLQRAVHATLTQEAGAVFSQPRLQATYLAFIEWLERHVDAFLQDRGWRLEDVVLEVLALEAHRGPRPSRDASDPFNALAPGLRTFVAQLSDQFVKQSTARSAVRRHLSRSAISITQRSLGARMPRPRWSMNGDWKCSLLEGGLDARTTSSIATANSLSLQSLFALMRELGTVSVRLDGDQLQPTVDVSSLLNVGGRSAGTRFLLDGKSQWFRSFPSGASTLALPIGGLEWGDHAGEVLDAHQEIQINLYAWHQPAPDSVTRESHNSLNLGCCFQLQLWTPSADVLVMRVAVARAVLDRPAAARQGLPGADAVAEQLPFWSLQRKLSLVRAWEPSLSAELQYVRIGR